jgi:ABC-type bacteriocin/lantibiotic exporter with double-glycine peptidase domain
MESISDKVFLKSILPGIFQNSFRFNTTDLNLIKKVINQSKLNKLINKLPLGLNSIVGERGALLSGGEQQRVGIARALYKNPKILILDEATSALDKETESELLKEILKLDSGITIVIVSHKEIELNIKINSFELKNKKIIQLR